MVYMFLFFTHSGAIKFQRMCAKKELACELMPVPRRLSSNCSVSAQVELTEPLDAFINSEVEKVFEKKREEYELCYEAD